MKTTPAGRVLPSEPAVDTKPVVEMTVGEVAERFYAWVTPIPTRVTAHERKGHG